MRRLSHILAVLAILAVAVPSVALAWQRCGKQVYSVSGFKKEIKRVGIYDDLKRQVMKHKSKYGYAPIDGDSYGKWFNRQLDVLPLARATRVPNSGCGGRKAHSVADKSLPRGRKIVGALPSSYTAAQVAAKKSGKFDTKRRIRVAYIAQTTCVNLGLRFEYVYVYGWIDKDAPAPKKPKKPTPPATPPVQQQQQQQQNHQEGTTSGPGSPVININVPVINAPVINVEQNQQQMQACAIAGGSWNHAVATCEFPSPPPPKTCHELGTCPPPPSVDSPPVPFLDLGAHVIVGGDDYVYYRAKDPDGDDVSATAEIVEGSAYARLNNHKVSPIMDESGAPCPAKTACYRATLWGEAAGKVKIRVTAYSKGPAVSTAGEILIHPEPPRE